MGGSLSCASKQIHVSPYESATLELYFENLRALREQVARAKDVRLSALFDKLKVIPFNPERISEALSSRLLEARELRADFETKTAYFLGAIPPAVIASNTALQNLEATLRSEIDSLTLSIQYARGFTLTAKKIDYGKIPSSLMECVSEKAKAIAFNLICRPVYQREISFTSESLIGEQTKAKEEINLLLHLSDSPFFPKLLYFSLSSESYTIEQEPAEYTLPTLPDLVSFEARIQLLAQFVCALHALHEEKKIHSHLVDENILFLKKEDSFVLQLANLITHAEVNSRISPMRAFTSPPEVFRLSTGKILADTSQDIWALGVLGFKLLFKKDPFPRFHLEETLSSPEKVERTWREIFESHKEACPAPYRDSLLQFFRKVLSYDPKERRSTFDLFTEPLFSGKPQELFPKRVLLFRGPTLLESPHPIRASASSSLHKEHTDSSSNLTSSPAPPKSSPPHADRRLQ